MVWFQGDALVQETRVLRVHAWSFLRNVLPPMALGGMAWFLSDLIATMALGALLYGEPWPLEVPLPLGIGGLWWKGMAWSVGTPMAGALVALLTFNLAVRRAGGLRLRFAEPRVWREGSRGLRRVGPGSLLKVGLCGALGCVGLPLATHAVLSWAFTNPHRVPLDLPALLTPLTAAIWLAVTWSLLAALHNVLAPLWGPIVFECDRDASARVLQRSAEPDQVRVIALSFLPVAIVCATLGGLGVLPTMVLWGSVDSIPLWRVGVGVAVVGGGLAVLGCAAGTVLVGAYAIVARLTGGVAIEVD